MKRREGRKVFAVSMAVLCAAAFAGTIHAKAETEKSLTEFKSREQEGEEVLEQSRMTAGADSYQAGNEPELALDGETSTFWHTSWDDRKELPQSITLNMQEGTNGVYRLCYTPRQDRDWNGTILDYRISISTDGENFTDVAEGSWAADRSEKTATFDSKDQVKAVRLTGITTKGNKESDDSLYVSAAELKLVCRDSFTRSKEELKLLVEKGETFIEERPEAGLEILKVRLEEAEAVLENELAVEESFQKAIQGLKEILEQKTSITGYKGDRMFATNGEPIQAHGGQITKWGDTWYWYGEDKSDGYRPVGVHLYTSKDLYNWEDKGLVLRSMKSVSEIETDPYFRELYGDLNEEERGEVFRHLDYHTAVLERPKVLYNEKTKKYVLWLHADGPMEGGSGSYAKAMAGVAVANRPEGPFRFLKASRLHSSHQYDGSDKGMARDMNLFLDEDKTAYILYAGEDNKSLYISRLNEEYTDLDVRENPEEGVDFTRNMANSWREAPAMFRYQDRYYLMTSGCTGWDPNEALYYTADSPLGPWKNMGNPCVGEESQFTFRTQSTCIFPVDAGKGQFIYMGDRWNKNDIADSRYVWLPVNFGYDFAMSLSAEADWTLEDLEGRSGYTLSREERPGQKYLIGDPEGEKERKDMPGKLIYGDETEIPVTVDWSPRKTVDTGAVGLGHWKGLVRTEEPFEVTMEAEWYQGNTVYFVDCNGSREGYYRGFSQLGIPLLNQKEDQAFDGVWGLVGEPGRYGGEGIFGSGYWAKAEESIVYRFTLPAGDYEAFAGFREWWTASRQAQLNVKAVKNEGTTGEELVSLADAVPMNTVNGDKNRVFSSSFVLEEKTVIEVSVDKVSGGDPLLSWMSIVKEPDSLSLTNTMEQIRDRLGGLDKEAYSESIRTDLEEALGRAEAYLAREGALQMKYDELEREIRNLWKELLSSKKEPEPETEPKPEPEPKPESKPEPPSDESPQVPTKPESFQITYHLKGGKNHPANPETYTGSVTLKAPARRNYRFMGWYADAGLRKRVREVRGGDRTLYAKWKKISLKQPKISVKKKGKNAVSVKMKKVSGAQGYEIRIARTKKMKKGYKTYLTKKRIKTIKRLKRNSWYYVKVRAYTEDSAGKKVYGKFSTVKRIK